LRKRARNYVPCNPRKEPLTPEKLKTFAGLENLSDTEAQDMVLSIRELARLLFEYTSGQYPIENEIL